MVNQPFESVGERKAPAVRRAFDSISILPQKAGLSADIMMIMLWPLCIHESGTNKYASSAYLKAKRAPYSRDHMTLPGDKVSPIM